MTRMPSPAPRHKLLPEEWRWAGVRGWFIGAGVAAGLGTSSAQASSSTAHAIAAELGPWLFASVALVLVALLAWWLGHNAGRREARKEYRARRADGTADSISSTLGPNAAPRSAPAASSDDAAAISYALSHDLRAPLRVVEGFARILKEDYGRQLDRIGNDHLDRLLGASARMHAMIEGMLSLAKLSSQPLAKHRISLSQMALDIVGELQSSQPQRQVSVQIAPDLEAVGDPVLLRQMLENLLSNAWKYSARTTQARISLRLTDKDGRKAYEVADNGAGFDMRSAGRLFGLFQRLHGQSDFPGTGLGLASVQRIVKLHGGQVWAEAEPGRGARFYFTLPG
jgi:signal transduction histidine kinase